MGGIESAGEKTSAHCRTAFISPGERHVGKVEDKAEGGCKGWMDIRRTGLTAKVRRRGAGYVSGETMATTVTVKGV